MSFILIDDSGPDRINTGVVSPHYFDLFRITPLFGRAFVEADDAPDAEPVLMLSHKYWLEKFGGDEKAVGRVVQLNNKPHRIVGVLPPIPQYPTDNDVYMPTSACPFRAKAASTMEYGRRTFSSLHVFARLRPGRTAGEAAAEVGALAENWAGAAPTVYRPNETGFSGWRHAAGPGAHRERQADPAVAPRCDRSRAADFLRERRQSVARADVPPRARDRACGPRSARAAAASPASSSSRARSSGWPAGPSVSSWRGRRPAFSARLPASSRLASSIRRSTARCCGSRSRFRSAPVCCSGWRRR